jgi:mTERF
MKLVIEFLATKIGYPKSYVAQNPVILHFSLQHRLIPRYYVLETLKSKGVPEFWRSLLPHIKRVFLAFMRVMFQLRGKGLATHLMNGRYQIDTFNFPKWFLLF